MGTREDRSSEGETAGIPRVFKLLPDVTVKEFAEEGFGAFWEVNEASDVFGRLEVGASLDLLLNGLTTQRLLLTIKCRCLNGSLLLSRFSGHASILELLRGGATAGLLACGTHGATTFLGRREASEEGGDVSTIAEGINNSGTL